MAVIFWLSSRSGDQLNSWLPHFQTWMPGLESFDPMHYAAYFVLAMAWAYGFGAWSFTWQGSVTVVLICILYGVTDEWHQSFVPNRSPDMRDLWHDAIGAATACAIWHLYRILRRRG